MKRNGLMRERNGKTALPGSAARRGNRKRPRMGLACALFAALLLTGCGGLRAGGEEGALPETEAEAAGESSAILLERDALLAKRNEAVYFAQATPFDTETEPSKDAVTIDLSKEEGALIIDAEGEYILYGELSDQIIVQAFDDERVHLYLEGVSVFSPHGPALWVKSAAKVVLTLADGEENFFKDTAIYMDRDETARACIFSETDLTINGGGSLSVTGNYRDAIRCKDVLKCLGGYIAAEAKRDGLRGSDGVFVREASLDIQAGDNGISSANAGEAGRGAICIEDADISITAETNGIWSVGDLYLSDTIHTADVKGAAFLANGRVYTDE